MRFGVRTRNGWWVSMGPVGWLLFGWLYLVVALAAGVGFVVYWLLRFLFLTLRELGFIVMSFVRRA